MAYTACAADVVANIQQEEFFKGPIISFKATLQLN